MRSLDRYRSHLNTGRQLTWSNELINYQFRRNQHSAQGSNHLSSQNEFWEHVFSLRLSLRLLQHSRATIPPPALARIWWTRCRTRRTARTGRQWTGPWLAGASARRKPTPHTKGPTKRPSAPFGSRGLRARVSRNQRGGEIKTGGILLMVFGGYQRRNCGGCFPM